LIEAWRSAKSVIIGPPAAQPLTDQYEQQEIVVLDQLAADIEAAFGMFDVAPVLVVVPMVNWAVSNNRGSSADTMAEAAAAER
jgi:hypothetical protein